MMLRRSFLIIIIEVEIPKSRIQHYGFAFEGKKVLIAQ